MIPLIQVNGPFDNINGMQDHDALVPPGVENIAKFDKKSMSRYPCDLPKNEQIPKRRNLSNNKYVNNRDRSASRVTKNGINNRPEC